MTKQQEDCNNLGKGCGEQQPRHHISHFVSHCLA